MKRSTVEIRKRIYEVCLRDPSVFYLTENLGEWDFHVGAILHDSRQVPQIEASLEDAFPGGAEEGDSRTGVQCAQAPQKGTATEFLGCDLVPTSRHSTQKLTNPLVRFPLLINPQRIFAR